MIPARDRPELLAGCLGSVGSARELARVLSDMCDAAYDKAPIVQNELLNRRHLSSAAAAARRSLVEAMVTHAGEKFLRPDDHPARALNDWLPADRGNRLGVLNQNPLKFR